MVEVNGPDAPEDNPTVSENRWKEVEGRDRNFLLNVTLFSGEGNRAVVFPHLGSRIMVDFAGRCLKILKGETWEPYKHPLLEMVTLVYLEKIDTVYPMGKDIVSSRDLKESHFFSGVHEFRLDELTRRYGKDPEGFIRAAEGLGGRPVAMADAASVLFPFPRVPLYYLLWAGDEEFAPRFSILFDRSIERVFQADAIWALVNLVSHSLIRADVFPGNPRAQF